MNAKILIAFAIIVTVTYSKTISRTKRQTYELPDGSELILGSPYRSSFTCAEDGYYADVDNNCQIFHVCHTAVDPEGKATMQQWSFFCGNQTVFNQLTLTCAFEEESIPCASASSFFYLNQKIGQPNVFFHDDNDIAQGYALYPSYRGGKK